MVVIARPNVMVDNPSTELLEVEQNCVAAAQQSATVTVSPH
jgi:hypothetical protein